MERQPQLTFCTQGFKPSVKIRGLLWGGTPSANARRRASSWPASSAPESAGTRRRRCCRETAMGVVGEEGLALALGLGLGQGKWRTRSARSRSWRRSLSAVGVWWLYHQSDGR